MTAPAYFTDYVNGLRSQADQFAAEHQCDDPLHPVIDFEAFPWKDWMEFTADVCYPLVSSCDPKTEQEALAKFRTVNPHYIAACLVMAFNRCVDRATEDKP